MSSILLYVTAFGFTSGILLRSFFVTPNSFSLFLICISLLLCLHSFISGSIYENIPLKKYSLIFLGALLFLSFGLGILRFAFFDEAKKDPILEGALSQKVSLEGIVTEEVDIRPNNLRLIVDAKSVSEGEKISPVFGRVLVIAPRYPEWQYGDRIMLDGTLKRPENFMGDDGTTFDYVSYLKKDGINYQMLNPSITLVSENQANPVSSFLLHFKYRFLENIQKVLPEPEAGLLGGLVVGGKRSLGKELLETFRVAGLIHIVVLSGYNITIVADFIGRIFSFLPKLFSISLGAVSIILFALMAGGGATVLRASLMALLVLFAEATGRKYDISRALLIAGVAMLIHNPAILVFDSSFQLSFMSTIGLIYFLPIVLKRLSWVTEKFQFRTFATATIATQIFVLPMLLYKMGNVSLVALPVNLLVLGFIPTTMLLGFFTGILPFVSFLLALPFGFLAYVFLWYELKVVEVFSSLPFASLHFSNVPILLVCFWYLLYAFILWKFHERKPTKPLSLTFDIQKSLG